jgi:AcrR family transcriptional regulator
MSGPTQTQDTKARLVDAAGGVLREGGFGAATAREIGARAGCNAALVFYHHGSLHNLLLAALDVSSAARLQRYGELLDATTTLRGLLQLPASLYREDIDTGHVRVLTEMVAGALSTPELRRPVAERVQPWVEVTEHALARILRGSPLARLVPSRDLAYGLVALFLGLEILSRLDESNARVLSLFDRLARAGTALDRLLSPRRSKR